MKALLDTQLGNYQTAVSQALSQLQSQNIIGRIWNHDHTVWNPAPEEISNRLGWLHLPHTMVDKLAEIDAFVEAVKADGYTHVLLLGMGGSSLAPEVFSKTFGPDSDGLHLEVLDSTHADTVLDYAKRLDYARTLFIVSTKSGGTVETQSFFKYFYNQVAAELGQEAAGEHFVAITDPGSKLEKQAADYQFRKAFLNDPNIGGRYSVLSYFGLVPAALGGVDIALLLERAADMTGAEGNEAGALLGAVLGACARNGRDKLTLVTSPEIASFGDWVEQLIAESTGKIGKGILPVVGEPLGTADVYGDDRLFVHLRLAEDSSDDEALDALAAAGHPVVRLDLADSYDMGGQFFLWEMATAAAGHLLGIHPFDQPNVELAKKRATAMVNAYQEKGQLPESSPETFSSETLNAFLAQAQPGDYIAIHAYVRPTAEMDAALQALRLRLRQQTKLAVTVGYGPRFLHSTGQLHKGDGGNGLFIQFTSDAAEDVAVPDTAGEDSSAITFNILLMAQALGDGQALRDEGRRVVHFHLGRNAVAALEKVVG
jgi:glucose-6-phosphate isomerase